jgi:hypothetical protein
MMMKNQLEKDFHSLNRHSREKEMMPKKMQGRKNKEENKERRKAKEKELKSLRTIIMPLGRFLMLREPFTSSSWRIVKGR